MFSNYVSSTYIRLNAINPDKERITLPLFEKRIINSEPHLLKKGEMLIPELLAKGMNVKKGDAKKDMKKIVSQIKSAAFTMYVYDDLLKEKINFKTMKPSATKLDMPAILKEVSSVKSCMDHSFADTEIVKCRVAFLNLAGSLTRNQEKKIKAKQKANKPPIYTGPDSVDMTPYLK